MKNKTILAILPSTGFYGKERSNIEVYNLLVKQQNIDLLVAINKNADKNIFNYTNKFNTHKILFPNRYYSKGRYIRYFYEMIISNISLSYLILKSRPNYIFLCDDLTFYDLFLPIVLSKAKIIYRIGDAPAFPKLVNYKYNSWVWRNIVCKKTDIFVYISKYIKLQIETHGRLNVKDTLIYNYPPTRNLSKKTEEYKYLNSEFIKVGYLGQIIKDKGVDLFLEAAIKILKTNQDVLFYIAGSLKYDNKFSEELIKKTEQFSFKENIVFMDEIDDIELFFKNIDVLCIPSVKQEPLGNVLVEAKRYYTPCVIFNSGGMPELIKNKHNGYICSSFSSESLVKGIEFYLKSPNLIKEHGINAFNSIEELEIGYDYYKRKWLKIFEF